MNPYRGWEIYPKAIYDIAIHVRDHLSNIPWYISENGMGYKDDFIDGKIDDTPRIEYVTQHLEYILKAVAEGVNVKGYYIWSLMDVLSWSNGYNKRYGLFYVDYNDQKRYPKKSAYWYKLMTERKEIVPLEDVEY